jgi:hypothetical protein
MARFWTLAALLVTCGCSDKPAPRPALPPAPMRLDLIPGAYERVSGKGQDWRLHAQRSWVEFPSSGRRRPNSGFILMCDSAFQFQFFLTETDLHINRANPQPHLFARIPRTLREGMTWDSVVQDGESQRRQKGRCSSDGDLFRVDFDEDGKTVHSMWFARVDGLVRWEGVAAEPLVRRSSLLEHAAATYADWRRVDDEVHYAPTLCRGPIEPPLRTSGSREQYYLFAKDREAYLHARDLDQPDNQIVIKESWIPGATKTKGPLFIMMKSGGEWTYGTATPDGRTITAEGKLASCIECHESDRTRDRMFGLQSCASSK